MRYEAFGKILHWVVAALFIAVIPTGLGFDEMVAGSPAKLRALDLHATLGLLLLTFAAWRLARRLARGFPPEHPAHRRYEQVAARVVQWVLLGASVGLPLSGLYATWAVGDPLIVLGTTLLPAAAPRGGGTLAFALHGGPLIVLVLTPIVVLHAVAALKHHWFDRDDTLRQMLPGRTRAASD